MNVPIVIVAARRSAIGKLEGAFADLSAAELGAAVVSDLLAATRIEPERVSEVILGQVLTGGAGQNPARQTALKAGLPVKVPATTVNMVCGAGQKSIHFGLQAIRSEEAEIVVVGGQDSMSQAPHLLYRSRRGSKMGDTALKDSMVVDGLMDAFHDVHMGVTAEEFSQRYQITRDAQDAFAEQSQQKTARAMEAGRFDAEIVPIDVAGKRGTTRVLRDEHPNPASTVESLRSLKPAFAEGGTVTAGNASGLNDGAAALVIMSEATAERLGLEPLARIAAAASAGVEPMLMGLGPVAASRRALEKAGWRPGDLDLVEVNEAFAVQAIAVNREMGWDTDRVNVNGGAIALGHPLAASGARIVVTLLHEMIRRDARRGLATLCIGGGQGIATCLERV
ncbi:acetyl-CoA C-acetyltransferase [Jiella sonneratiae]|uniref:Acetyl-CoA C-acetyltransferase n=1 Tax=Jiella sonneratiae TaxID=2816856 RepID=A0ABS3J5A4_9HYPH|nr:acetyl-CoA C-acetyltransferase [Jiella sonneratiae]MBO0904267.1 acetyl-CoA C-acetyltransferase [Jiella sonneratiae]